MGAGNSFHLGELPGGLVFRIWRFHFCGPGSTPRLGTEIPLLAAACLGKKKNSVLQILQKRWPVGTWSFSEPRKGGT